MYRFFLFSLMVVVVSVLGCSSGLDSKGQAFVKGREFFFNKDYDSAIEQFTKVIEMDEKFAEAYTFRGNCYSALKKNDEAVKDFSKAIEIDPYNRGAFSNRSLAYKAMGKLPQAKADALKANKIAD